MKTSFFSFFLLLFVGSISSNIAAQTDNQATFEAYLKTVYDVYEKGGYDQLSQYYSPNSAEVDPTGRLTSGMKELKAAWDEMEKMLDAKPKFQYKLTSWRLVKPDIAILTWDTHDEFSIGGQKVMGDNTASALLRKEGGKWLIEFDQLTPKMNFEMPDKQADMEAIKALGNEAYAAFAARDAARFAACYAEDVDFISPFGMHIKGSKAVEQVHAELFKVWANAPASKVDVEGMDIRLITPDVAICRWSHKEVSDLGGKATSQETTFINACQRVNGKWLVAAMSMTPKMQAPDMGQN